MYHTLPYIIMYVYTVHKCFDMWLKLQNKNWIALTYYEYVYIIILLMLQEV